MRWQLLILLGAAVMGVQYASAQKAVTEGTIRYEVQVKNADNQQASYTISVKNGRIRKELLWNNKMAYLVIIDYNQNKAWVLREVNGKNYAIERTLAELQSAQARYRGYRITETPGASTSRAGLKAHSGTVGYSDGTGGNIEYSSEFYFEKGLAFEQFPDARMLPLVFSYNPANYPEGLVFRVTSFDRAPVEEAIFRVPPQYRIITDAEFQKAVK
ncbi:MAG: hypothetical protein EBZ77_02950 [Chitinophagia bacterium]|nr:hypothetical protein [Chitinophagia bacterium]